MQNPNDDDNDRVYGFGVALGGFMVDGNRIIAALKRAESLQPEALRELIACYEGELVQKMIPVDELFGRLQSALDEISVPPPPKTQFTRKPLINQILWSPARAQVYKNCPRQYWYRTIGFWGGWDARAAAETRDLYRMKLAATLPELAGQWVHTAIRNALETWMDGRFDVVNEKEATDRFREEVEGRSQRALSEITKATPGLVESLLGREITDGAMEKWAKVVERCLRNFKAYPVADICARHAEGIVREFFASPFTQADFDGAKALAVPDVVVRLPDEIIVIDWKSGAERPDHRDTARAYELVVRKRLNDWHTRVRLHYAYLSVPVGRDWRFTPDDLHLTEQRIRGEFATFRQASDDPGVNCGSSEKFRPSPGRICRNCIFSRVCEAAEPESPIQNETFGQETQR